VRTRLLHALVAAGILMQAGCYSFTGASVPSHLKTIAIPLLDDQSGFGEPNLREDITTALINAFTSDNTLSIADRSSADAVLEGVILPIKDGPLVVTGGEQVTTNRITISVKMTFQDLKLRKKVWEKTYTNTGDYDPGGGFTAREGGITEATRKITDDVVLDTVSGW
jgi:Lipopolysaccharide-assembly